MNVVEKLSVDSFFEEMSKIPKPKFNLNYTHEFKKSVRASYKSNKDLNLLLSVVTELVQIGVLDSSYLPHPLKGFPQSKERKVMECHIQSDWLLVWIQENTSFTLMLFDTGTHSDLFNSKKLRKGRMK